MSWSTSELRMRLVPLNWFKPSSKIFYWPFQGGTSFVDLLCFCLSCFCYAFVRVCLYCLWSSAGKWLTSWLSFVVSTVSLSISHWYPGSGVVLDCIDFLIFAPLLTDIQTLFKRSGFLFSIQTCKCEYTSIHQLTSWIFLINKMPTHNY